MKQSDFSIFLAWLLGDSTLLCFRVSKRINYQILNHLGCFSDLSMIMNNSIENLETFSC